MRTLEKFTGINNVQPIEQLSDRELSAASNVDIDMAGKARRRAGSTLASAVHHANVWKADGFTLATSGAAGDLVNVDSSAVLRAGLGHTRLWHWNLPDGRTLYSNGTQQGIAGAAAATDWGVPVPASTGTAMGIAGSLHAGAYQWSLTYARTADGLEGGPIDSGAAGIDIADGGILLSDLPTLAGHKINVYLTSHNGSERYLAGSTTLDSFSYTGGNAALQQRLLTQDLSTPPLGRLVAFWRGRTLVAVGNALFASRPNAWHLFDLVRDFKQFSADITLVQPVTGGIWLGTEAELSFLAGTNWDELARQVRQDDGVVLGSGVQVPGADVMLGKGRASGECMACICGGYVVAGAADGTLIQLSRDRYRTDAAEVSAAFRMNGEIPQYVAIVQ